MVEIKPEDVEITNIILFLIELFVNLIKIKVSKYINELKKKKEIN